jgi:hypothetical protein
MADFSKAKTEHHRDYLRRHIELNYHVKIAISTIDHLNSFSDDDKLLSEKMSHLVLKAGERWTRTVFTNPRDDLKSVRQQISEMAIARVYSSFNVFTDEIEGSYNELKTKSEISGGSRIERIYSTFNWDTKNISYLLPVLDFYEITRHCIVHQMGAPNKQISEISSNVKFIDAVKNWPTVIKDRKISPPPSIEKGYILLSPHHPITYSDVCLRVVRDVDQNLFDTLGLPFFARRIANRDILENEPGFDPKQKDAYTYVKSKLTADYEVMGLTISEVRQSLGGEQDAKHYFHKYKEKRHRDRI